MTFYPSPTTLAGLVGWAAAMRPDGEALIGLDSSFSWSEVEERTARLAQLLVAGGVEKGERVAVLRPKGHESFEAVHAILQAGGIMVPLDPMAPAATIASVLVDAGVTALIGHAATIKRSAPWKMPGIELKLVLATGACESIESGITAAGMSLIDINELSGHTLSERLPVVAVDDPAYLIYTSGSTGTPKGILHTHSSGLAYARCAVETHQLSQHDRLAAMTGLHFDMSTFELYAMPLAAAAIVEMGEPHLRFPASFTERAAEQQTTIWYGVTFLLQQILERGALETRNLSSLRAILFAGEVFPAAALRALMEALPNTTFENVYGPAEVNASNVYRLTRPPADGEAVPIGPGCGDAEMRVVDENEMPVPPGTKGVLWISASTRMREYWNRSDLTAASSRRRTDGPDWYVSGDLVSMDSDGMVWFHGRSDHQVKLRGIRVELEGVESTLADHPDILHAVAGPWGQQPGTLAATVVLRAGADLDLKAIQKWAAGRLSPVAIPAHIDLAETLPTTPSGKIDRKRIRIALAAVKETV